MVILNIKYGVLSMHELNNINTVLCEKANRIKLGLLCFGHAKVGKEWNGKIYNSIHSRLYYIVNGNAYIITANNDKIVFEPGYWYLIPSGCSFVYGCDTSMEHLYFHLKLHDVDGLDLLSKFPSPVRQKTNNDKSDFFIGLLPSDNMLNSMKIHNEVYSVLISVLEKYDLNLKNKELSPCVTKAIRYIKQHLSVQLQVDDIAKHAYVSRSTLTKKFNKELSMSIIDYIYNSIMFEAGQLLSNSNISVLAVSEKFGFSDQFYFSKRFKAKFGMSPREYRKMPII